MNGPFRNVKYAFLSLIEYDDWNMKCASNRSIEILRALELLLLFRNERSGMRFKQIMKNSGSHNIPPVLQMLKLLENRNLLERNALSGKVAWRITDLGCRTRDRIEEIINNQIQL